MTSEELRTLADNAAPGPWRISEHSPVNIVGPNANIIGVRHDGGQAGGEYEWTGRLICALGPDAARLLADAMDSLALLQVWAGENDLVGKGPLLPSGQPTAADLLERFAALGAQEETQ